MTTRLTCDVSNTQVLLENVLASLKKGERVMFLCDSGCGGKVAQRLRVKLSRTRESMRRRGKKIWYFRLSHDVIPWTESARRYDAVIMYASQDETHKALEVLEDLVGHSQKL